MSREIKVYGWDYFRVIDGRRVQTREIVAAYSVAEVLRLAGVTRSDYYHQGCVTQNEDELALALSAPGRVFYTNNINRYAGKPVWIELRD